MRVKVVLAVALCVFLSRPLDSRQANPSSEQTSEKPANLSAGKRLFERDKSHGPKQQQQQRLQVANYVFALAG